MNGAVHHRTFTREQEMEEFSRLRRLAVEGQYDAWAKLRQALVTKHLGLVRSLAKRMVTQQPFEDRFQDGVFGLMRAVEKFDPAFDVRFSTYATYWIRQALYRPPGVAYRTIQLSAYAWQRRNRSLQSEPLPYALPWTALAFGEDGLPEDWHLAFADPSANVDDQLLAYLEYGRMTRKIEACLRSADEEHGHLRANAFCLLTGYGSEEDPITITEASARLGISPFKTRKYYEETLRMIAAHLSVQPAHALQIVYALTEFRAQRNISS
jgi:RNA polymerase sigma factor (sigma-70 family)